MIPSPIATAPKAGLRGKTNSPHQSPAQGPNRAGSITIERVGHSQTRPSAANFPMA